MKINVNTNMNKFHILIFILFLLYTVLMLIDFKFTYEHAYLIKEYGNLTENNPLCVFFIQTIGYPLNLFIPFTFIGVSLSYNKTWLFIGHSRIIFYLFYNVLLILIVSHAEGILSWIT